MGDRLRTLALSTPNGSPEARRSAAKIPHAEGRRHAPNNLLTVMVMASASPMNPSTVILRELLLSLRFLQLPPQNPVLLAHDGPRIKSKDAQREGPHGPAQTFPPRYLQYLSEVETLLPAAMECTGLSIQLMLRASNGMLSGNLAFALSSVRTPYVLKVEHDHIFTRPVDILGVVRDMMDDARLKYVRFNRRHNLLVNCDRGDFGALKDSILDVSLAKQLWGPHVPLPGRPLRNEYTRSSCFSDMNHLTSTRYYRNEILPIILDRRYYPAAPETLMQDQAFIARNHSYYGTFIFGGLSAPPTIAHIDAALRGVGELLPQVRNSHPRGPPERSTREVHPRGPPERSTREVFREAPRYSAPPPDLRPYHCAPPAR
jgi:hypothetical protein